MKKYESFTNNSLADKLGSWLNRRQLLARLPKGRDVVIDLGSGMEARNILPLRRFFRLCIATDFDVSARVLSRNVVAVRSNIVQLTSSLPDHSVDMFLLISVLEHVEKQDILVSEIHRALKPGGHLVINVPTWRGRPILEKMAFRLNLTSRFLINDHKRYYSKDSLWQVLRDAKFLPENIEVGTHKLGLSAFAMARKA